MNNKVIENLFDYKDSKNVYKENIGITDVITIENGIIDMVKQKENFEILNNTENTVENEEIKKINENKEKHNFGEKTLEIEESNEEELSEKKGNNLEILSKGIKREENQDEPKDLTQEEKIEKEEKESQRRKDKINAIKEIYHSEVKYCKDINMFNNVNNF
jgi:hypothetical protein